MNIITDKNGKSSFYGEIEVYPQGVSVKHFVSSEFIPSDDIEKVEKTVGDMTLRELAELNKQGELFYFDNKDNKLYYSSGQCSLFRVMNLNDTINMTKIINKK